MKDNSMIPNSRRWWLVLLLMVSLGISLLVYLLWAAYDDALSEAESSTKNYVKLVQSTFDGSLRRVDAEMQEASRRLPALLGQQGKPEDLGAIKLHLQGLQQNFPELIGYRITDAEGNLLVNSGEGQLAFLGDRDYFLLVKEKPDGFLAFSAVEISRIIGRPVLVMARGIHDTEGHFLGMLSASLDVGYFQSLFMSLALGPQGTLSIRRSDDHHLVLRFPNIESEVNKPLNQSHPIRQMLEKNVSEATLTFSAQTDRIERVYAFSRLESYPFYVIAGLSKEDVLSSWRTKALVVGSVSIVLFVSMLLLFHRLIRSRENEWKNNEQIRQQQSQLREAQRIARIGSWEKNWVTGKMVWSEELCHLFEVNPQFSDELPSDFFAVVHPEDRSRVEAVYRESVMEKRPYQIEHRLLMPDGRIKHMLESGETRYDAEGRPLRSIATVQDITGIRQMEAQMQLLASAFKYSGEAILITNQDNLIIAINPAFTNLTGYEESETLGRSPDFLSAGKVDQLPYSEILAVVNEKGFWQGEILDRRKDGTVFPKWMSVSAIRDERGQICYYVAHFTDVSEARAVEAQLEHMAHHDALTGLPNRFSLQGRLEQALSAARREKEELALLFIDLDRFKVINDTLGHHVGDLLLIEVARRLTESVRDSDVVARLGGDEFVVMLTGIEQGVDVIGVAEKIVLSVGYPYAIDAHDLYTSPSIGIALYPQDGEDADTLMKNADAAMYHAKSAGRNNFQFFDARMNDAVVERLNIEQSLRQALARDEFVLHFQPIINLETDEVEIVEALVRWNQPEQGMISPDRFIPVAEETGLIQPLGDWVFWAACRQLADFRALGINNVKIGINISAMQMRNDNLPILVRGAVEVFGFKAEDLVFEITESVAMERPEDTIRLLNSLHEMGVSLAIDDFGTGYSSLSYLRLFPIDHLKLDRSFVKDIGTGPDSDTICDATLSLAHSLGLRLVAEGVETPEQLAYLKARGADLIQGYLYSRPLSADQLIEFINNR